MNFKWSLLPIAILCAIVYGQKTLPPADSGLVEGTFMGMNNMLGNFAWKPALIQNANCPAEFNDSDVGPSLSGFRGTIFHRGGPRRVAYVAIRRIEDTDGQAVGGLEKIQFPWAPAVDVTIDSVVCRKRSVTIELPVYAVGGLNTSTGGTSGGTGGTGGQIGGGGTLTPPASLFNATLIIDRILCPANVSITYGSKTYTLVQGESKIAYTLSNWQFKSSTAKIWFALTLTGSSDGSNGPLSNNGGIGNGVAVLRTPLYGVVDEQSWAGINAGYSIDNDNGTLCQGAVLFVIPQFTTNFYWDPVLTFKPAKDSTGTVGGTTGGNPTNIGECQKFPNFTIVCPCFTAQNGSTICPPVINLNCTKLENGTVVCPCREVNGTRQCPPPEEVKPGITTGGKGDDGLGSLEENLPGYNCTRDNTTLVNPNFRKNETNVEVPQGELPPMKFDRNGGRFLIGDPTKSFILAQFRKLADSDGQHVTEIEKGQWNWTDNGNTTFNEIPCRNLSLTGNLEVLSVSEAYVSIVTLTANALIFYENGTFDYNGVTAGVKKGDVKLSYTVENWPFNLSNAEAKLYLGITIRSTGQRNNVTEDNHGTPQLEVGSNGRISLPLSATADDVNNVNITVSYIEDENNGNSTQCGVIFVLPKFQTKIYYDPVTGLDGSTGTTTGGTTTPTETPAPSGGRKSAASSAVSLLTLLFALIAAALML